MVNQVACSQTLILNLIHWGKNHILIINACLHINLPGNGRQHIPTNIYCEAHKTSSILFK